MKPGGYPTPEDDGLNLPTRPVLRERISALAEGALFSHDDIASTPEEHTDFAAMRGFDYVHVIDGYFVGIVESKYLRHLPRIDALLSSYCALRDCSIAETGDRVAWRLGLKEWEPIKGYRYYSTGPSEVLSFGQMRVQMLPAHAWQLDESEAARIFRAFHDLEPKERVAAIARARRFDRIGRTTIEAAIGWMDQQDFGASDDEDQPSTSQEVRQCLEDILRCDEE